MSQRKTSSRGSRLGFMKRSKKSNASSTSLSATYPVIIGTVEPDAALRRVRTVTALCDGSADLSARLQRFALANAAYADECAALSRFLLDAGEDQSWISPTGDRTVLTATMNFGDVLEALSERYRSLASAMSGQTPSLDALASFGAHEVEAHFDELVEQFDRYEEVNKAIGSQLARKKRSGGKAGTTVFDGGRLDAFEAQINAHVSQVENKHQKFAQCCDHVEQQKLSVWLRAVDATMRTLGRDLADAGALFGNLTDTHKRLESALSEQDALLQCPSAPLPPLRDTLTEQMRSRWGTPHTAERNRLVVLRDDELLLFEAGKPFDLVNDRINLRLSAVRVLTSDDDNSFPFEIVPHVGAPLCLFAPSDARRRQWIAAIGDAVSSSLTATQMNQLSERERELARRAGKILRVVPGVFCCALRVCALNRVDKGNRECVDCGSDNPLWASINLGALLCVRCAGLHRDLSTDVSKVRSVALDRWEPETLLVLQSLGNAAVNSVFEGAEIVPRSTAVAGARLSLRLDLSAVLSGAANAAASHAPTRSLAADYKPSKSSDTAVLRQFIVDKYVNKKYVRKTTPSASVHTLSQRLYDEISRPSCELRECLRLIVLGADTNFHSDTNRNRTPLHQAVLSDNVTAVELLLRHGARLAERDAVGWTPFHYACYLNEHLIVHLLMKRCSKDDLALTTSDKQTAEELATMAKASAAVAVLDDRLDQIELLSVEDVLSHNQVLRKLSVRQLDSRSASLRRSRLHRVTTLRTSTTIDLHRSPPPSGVAPAPPAAAPSPPPKLLAAKSSPSSRRHSPKKSRDRRAAALASASASNLSTSTGSVGSVGAGSETGDETEDDAPDTNLLLIKNELLNAADGIANVLDTLRATATAMRSVADATPLCVQLARLRPQLDATHALFSDFAVPAPTSADLDTLDGLRAVIDGSIDEIMSMVERLVKELPQCDDTQLTAVATIIQHVQNVLSE